MSLTSTDANARRAIAEALDETLVVEAAAGTGKTTALVERIIRILASPPPTGAEMKRIVAVTFTEKAAGELKLRLRESLEQKRERAGDDAVRARLDLALETLEEAHVNTIHGFCAELLRERPVEARVDPLFTVLTEPQAKALYNRAFESWLQEALENPPEGVRRALRRTSAPIFGTSGADDGPVGRLREAGRQLAEWRSFDAPWTHLPFGREAEIRRLVAALHDLARLTATASSPRDNLFVDTDAVRRLSRQIELEQSFGHDDLDGWEARLIDLVRDRGFSRTRKGSGYKYGPSASRADVLTARDALYADLHEFRRQADADLAARLQSELRAATRRYQQLKVEAGALDFADLLTCARELIEQNEAVRRHLQAKFTRIFVDEFQDTDPVQAAILMLLAADDPGATDWQSVTPIPGKLFIVGDPKQAIYRFRGTDVGTYWQVSRHLEQRGARLIDLSTSYRSVPHIQRFVNAAFGPEMVGDERTLQARYVALEPDRPGDERQPAILALPVPKPYGSRGPLRPSARAIEQSLPDAVGALIAWLVDEPNGWCVAERQPDGTEALVPLKPRHIAVLFRRFVSFGEDITRPYADAIEARGIPHLLVGGKAFHNREEVETIRAALAAIEWPDDELSIFATLKGSLFAIDDELLFEFKDRFGPFHPFRIPKELGGNSGVELALAGEPTTHLLPIASALRLLQELHRSRNYRPVADTLGRLLAETRAHVGFILRPAGEQALANVLHVAELARQYETGGGISFRGFIDELSTAAESETAEAPILEESSDGVRLMTAHKAKGLEFPVVILADLTCRLSRSDAGRYVDATRRLCAMKIGGWAPQDLHDHEQEEVERDRAEGVRLAYVAATRARDLLVVPAVGDEPWEEGWLAPLNRALYPPLESRRVARRGPGCPAFKSKDSVLERPNQEPAGASTVCPGEHTFVADGYSIVWWDPGSFDLGRTPAFGVRREELIVKDVPRDVVAGGRSAYDRWRLARADARAAGGAASVNLRTARDWAADAEAGSEAIDTRVVRVVDLGGQISTACEPQTTERPGGTLFGLLTHSVLAQAPLDAGPDVLRDIASLEARALGLGEAEASTAAAAVARVLRHEILDRARSAHTFGRCRRETPVTLTLPDGTFLEGIVDLAFEEEAGWTVVDYKTDRELTAGDERYLRQVAIYAAAIARATGKPATGLVLRV
jgi:ATP-dependent exoDNAse (exonuclease V) beta subunit